MRPDWMILLEISSGAQFDHFDISSDLGFCDIDQNYDWFGDLRIRCPDLDLAIIPDFIQQACEFANFIDEPIPDSVVDPQSLNTNQRMVYDRIETHYTTLLTNPERLISMSPNV